MPRGHCTIEQQFARANEETKEETKEERQKEGPSSGTGTVRSLINVLCDI